ncbi:MAG TPA: glycosyltransferase family 4 protein [Paracoccus sp. (in: a-proteobacteria)]|nr:glycosyltransferase family 4 protein [Paracoccus sp. (in: a-proteobacteria)]
MATVAYIVNTYPRGSHSFIWREIAALERRGLRVHRFAARRAEESASDPAIKAEAARTEYLLDRGPAALAAALARAAGGAPLRLAHRRAVAGESSLGQQLAYVAQACILRDRCAALGVRHLHAHFGTNPARVAAYCRMLGGPPFSLTVHGPEEFDRPQALDLAGKAEAAAFTVGVSQFGRSQLMRWVAPGHWDRLKVVHCGLDLADFPAPPPLPAGPPTLVAVGRFSEQKGFGLLMRAMQRLRATRPDLRLVLVGDGELRPAIEAEAIRADVGDSLRLTGWQDQAGVRRAMAQAHALVVPSFAEGLPVVIMEAMAMGRPVLSTWVAGIPELVIPGDCGWLVPPGDVDALAGAMQTVAETPLERLAAMGQAARARVVARHDVDRSAAILARLMKV